MKQRDERLPVNRFVLFFCLAIGGVVLDLATKSAVFHHHFEPENWPPPPRQSTYWLIEGGFNDINGNGVRDANGADNISGTADDEDVSGFGVQCSLNPGALFGFGKGYSSVFAAISFIAVFGIVVWLFVFKQAWDRWLTTAFGLITGGILGNLYDRLGLGYLPSYPAEIKNNVRDWILLNLEGVWFFDPWPNFNIADSLLVTGAIMLLVQTIFEVKKQKRDGQERQHDSVRSGDN